MQIKVGRPSKKRRAELAKRFAWEYVKDYNATAAALRMGYAPKTARYKSSALIARPDIQSAIAEATRVTRKVALEEFQVERRDVLRELVRVGMSDPRGLFDADGRMLPMNQWPDDLARAVASVESVEEFDSEGNRTGIVRKVKLWDKNSALSSLARHLGMFAADNAQRGAGAVAAALAMIDGHTKNLIDMTPSGEHSD